MHFQMRMLMGWAISRVIPKKPDRNNHGLAGDQNPVRPRGSARD
jgi:hypothetical protein